MKYHPIITQIADNQTNLEQWLREAGQNKVLTVADTNTAIFARTKNLLTLSPVPGNPDLVPDETAIGKIFVAAADAQVIIAVGSGTICDLVRYVSSRLGLPYYIVATAASMDGYTSSVAPLTVGGYKQTFPSSAPTGVIIDPEIYNTASVKLTAAGFSDMMGKFTSVTDWEMEGLLFPEAGDFCPDMAKEMRKTAEDCYNSRNIMDALIASGLIMQKVGNSKPASGSEHHLSHYWEMKALAGGKQPALHGAKVGVATLAALQATEWLLEEEIDWNRKDKFDIDEWKNEINHCFGSITYDIQLLWADESPIMRESMRTKIKSHWPKLQRILSQNNCLRHKLEEAIIDLGGPTTPAEIGVAPDTFYTGILHANRLRRRFTVWRLLDLLGLLPKYAQKLSNQVK